MGADDHTPCPNPELLVGYLTAALNAGGPVRSSELPGADVTDAERGTIEAHLRTCDRCVEILDVAYRRLRIASEVPVPVPVAVLDRAAAAQPAAVTPPLSVLAWVREKLSPLVRLPILIPASVAVGALLVVATQTWLHPSAPRELTRSVPMRLSLRVTATEAFVRAQPTARADVVATLTHGEVVEVSGEERDWYRVALPTGSVGWVDRRAFQ